MHGNSDVVDTAGFSAFFAQARQSRLGEVTWKPERCSQVQFCPGEKCFALARKYFRPSKRMVAKAKMTLALLTNFTQARRFSLKREGFSLKLEIFAQAKSKKLKIKIWLSILID